MGLVVASCNNQNSGDILNIVHLKMFFVQKKFENHQKCPNVLSHRNSKNALIDLLGSTGRGRGGYNTPRPSAELQTQLTWYQYTTMVFTFAHNSFPVCPLNP